jgi:uncharacterized RDD family membrane protein YckC
MIQEALPHLPAEAGNIHQTTHDLPAETESAEVAPKSTLIEFPGVTRAVPEWRKQLSKRVREVQERKAREAAEELAAAQEAGLVSCALPSGQLELVPDLENPVTNPIVTKALERLERARHSDRSPSAAAGAAPALARQPEFSPEPEPEPEPVVSPKPKLTVVAPAVPEVAPLEAVALDEDAIEPAEQLAEPACESPMLESSPQLEVTLAAEEVKERKPVRLISDDDVALSYLENCLSVPALAADTRADIPGLSRRFMAGILDLLFIALMVSPAAAAIHFSGGNWADPKIIGIMSGITAVTMFAYLTVSTALTGRTLAKRMLSLRTIDLRTGLIPTGGQSITRALAYVFSLAFLGLGLAYALIDRDGRTVYDRLSKTIVIRA